MSSWGNLEPKASDSSLALDGCCVGPSPGWGGGFREARKLEATAKFRVQCDDYLGSGVGWRQLCAQHCDDSVKGIRRVRPSAPPKPLPLPLWESVSLATPQPFRWSCWAQKDAEEILEGHFPFPS